MSHADEEIEVQEADSDLDLGAPEADEAEGDAHNEDDLAVEDPTDAELRFAYRVATRSRTTEEYFVRMVSRGEVKFSIWGPGEEVHGAATALALHKVCEPDKFGMVLHYRNACLASMWSELHGYENFALDVFRQQFTRAADPMSGGRQMVNHFNQKSLSILPVQSPVGMQLGKAAGYAKGFALKGITDGVAMAVIGDGTTAEGDLHDAMTAASVWQLPLIIMVTNNEVAISTVPPEGIGIKKLSDYAHAFGFEYDECDATDFWDCYRMTVRAATYVRDEQKPIAVLVDNMPRLNGHSSAADPSFLLDETDPILLFGDKLVEMGVLEEDDIVKRIDGEGRDYFAHHEPGNIMAAQIEDVKAIIEQVRHEPEPEPSTVYDHIYPPFPEVVEQPASGQTAITYAGAIRAALSNIIANHGGALWGEDVGRLGGVMTATQGLKNRHPDRVTDAPLNEPLIVGTAVGAGLHDGIVALPEIQFGDYSLNAFHWITYMGNLYWSSNGTQKSSVVLRMPVDPFGGGAIYHSMSLDGYFTAIPGLVIIMPSTSYDVYGLLLTAAEYGNTVVCLEPKFAYRHTLGPAFPGEPTDPGEIAELKKAVMHGEIPDIDPSVRVPFSKAATRRQGGDVTIVAWGRAVWTSMDAAAHLAEDGIEAEVIDLRTLVPPDLDAVYASVEKTGRLVVASEDRPFAGFVRSIQGHVVERFEGIPTRAIGQRNVPGIAQSPVLEAATILTSDDVQAAVREVAQSVPAAPQAAKRAEARVTRPDGEPGAFAWIPPRYYLG